MTQYIADKTHFKEVIARVPKAKDALRTGTENIKDLCGRAAVRCKNCGRTQYCSDPVI